MIQKKLNSLFAPLSDIALEHVEQGISVIPLRLDGSKGPALGGWKQYQSELPTFDEVREWFKRPAGMAVICGLVSGGLEVIDFDREALEIFPRWQARVADIVCKLPIVETPSGGYHVYYRCSVISGNHKIAQISEQEKEAEKGTGQKETLIETRAEGGYIVSCSSPAEVHERKYPYVQVAGPIIPEIPVITPAERLKLWQAGRMFDRRGLLKKEIKDAQPKPYRSNRIDDDSPWKAFDSSVDWGAMLRADGWTSKDDVSWMRPGKYSGSISAMLRQATGGDWVLVVYSTNAPIPVKTHSASSYLAHSRFAGCKKAACRAIREGVQW